MFEVLATLLVLGVVGRAAWGRWTGGRGERLTVVLARAEAEGVITADQHRRILDLAPDDARAAHLSGATWLAAVAGLFVIAGVALLVAHNWERIGPAVRIVGFVAALTVVGEAAIRTRNRSLALALPLEIAWLFLPLVGIGLYGQTFQLSGDPISPFLCWLAMTAPIAWLSPRPIAASIHVVALVTVLFVGNFGSDGMLALTRAHEMPPPVTAWLLSLVILCAVAFECVRLLPRDHRRHFFGVVALWLFGLLVTSTPLQINHPGWLTVASIALATVWLVADLAAEGSTPERTTSATVWLATLYGFTFIWHTGTPFTGDASVGGAAITIGALVVAVVGAATVARRGLSYDPRWQAAGALLLIAPVLVSLLVLADDIRVVHLGAALMNALLVAIATALVWHGAVRREPVHVNGGIGLLLVVLITRFVDVFGSFLEGGVGFIVAGVLLAALAYALDRTRRRLIDLPQGAGS